MDPDVRQGFATISSQIADMRNAVIARIESVELRVDQLTRDVYASDPPPGMGGAKGAPRPAHPPRIVQRVSDAEAGLDAVHGAVLAVAGKVDDPSKGLDALGGKLDRLAVELAAQSKAMGVRAPDNTSRLTRLRAYLFSREGLRDVQRLGVLLVALYASIYASIHGAPVMPWLQPAPVAAPQGGK